MNKLVFSCGIFIALLSATGCSKAMEETSLSPREGIWHVNADDSNEATELFVGGGRIEYAEEGMDGLEFSSPIAMDGNTGIFTFGDSGIKGTLTFNPADSSMTVIIPGAFGEGSDFNRTFLNQEKATLVYYWIKDDRPVYADTTFTNVTARPGKFETFRMVGLSPEWYEVAIAGDTTGYVRRGDFQATFNHIPDAWLRNVYSCGSDDGLSVENISLSRDGDIAGVEIDCIYADGRPAVSLYYAGKIEGNKIHIDSLTSEYEVFESLDLTKFEKLEIPFSMQMLMHYDQPMIVTGNKIYNLNTDI